MSEVLDYLDCGCAILKDGRRLWCPSCLTTQSAERKTREEVEDLKSQWEFEHYSYDLHDKPGFEEYYYELRAHQYEYLYRRLSSELSRYKAAISVLQEIFRGD